MGLSKQAFMEERERESMEEETYSMQPARMVIEPGQILTLSKESAETFHARMKDMIFNTGYGLFEYLEVIQFMGKLKEVIFGREGFEGDKEFIGHLRDELKKYNGKHTTERGVRFENVETGTKYDYSHSAEWSVLDKELEGLKARKKAIEDRLKKIEPGKALVDPESGETLIGPAKTSKSSVKITLAK